MNPLNSLLTRLIADNDQERMECRAWWANTTLLDKILVWGAIHHKYDDPAMEIMSRFAQLAFGEMAAEWASDQSKEPTTRKS